MKRLNIVIPYRNRADHLNKFVPLVRAYFARDKLDREIPYRVLVIEQEHGLPFNRGALKNVGFVLGRNESAYTCFHDVDYLPVWADYSYPRIPTSIVWYGANHTIDHTLETFFGAVVLIDNKQFSMVNGYSNSYWGWGYEDDDLRNRFGSAGIRIGRRKGTFQPLPHDNEGYRTNGDPTAISRVNGQIFMESWKSGSNARRDGLDSLVYEVLDRRSIPEGPEIERAAIWEMVTVRFNMQPLRSQIEATERVCDIGLTIKS
jgi:hypothetical protein